MTFHSAVFIPRFVHERFLFQKEYDAVSLFNNGKVELLRKSVSTAAMSIIFYLLLIKILCRTTFGSCLRTHLL